MNKTKQVQHDHNLPYFPCYISDWLIDTQDLTDEQDGAYFRLVRYQWKNGSIPDDPRIMRKIADSIDETWPVIQKYFVKNDEGNWYNKRTDRERDKIISKINAGSKGGSKHTSKVPSKTPSKPSSKSVSKTTSKTGIPQTSDLKDSELITENSKLNNIISFFPNSFFHNMTVPNILLGVDEKHGRDALRAACEKVALITDKKKLTGPYIRAMLKNMDLEGIAKGTASAAGEKLEWLSRLQAVDLASKNKNGKTTDEIYRALRDEHGANIVFPEDHRYAGESVWVKK